MPTFYILLSVVIALLLGSAGVMTAVTGRVAIPWLRGSVREPMVWGAGALVLALAAAAVRFAGFGVSMALTVTGLLLVCLSYVLRGAPSGR
ncbi:MULTISPECIES: hypothetical protein [Streptomyces]|uniref:Uncharacterized protein n=1 Tax=Streptomyces glycanivorans TaxID=3033808 RepID=A0ABY9JF23_9ACTN|nr:MULTISPECIES: hypothetical protein [unclassified Streptomyces]WSQ79817.1 hypothetical protein OG725_23165 [Streptomyces sp. NBC_01213]TXS09030.1 hypothetical protein EAO68_33780 [Streptomyces sp. wa22]WLQ66366.1 hypothetical protein P8A20_23570 [Streptomyces sp. Alt3]WSQ87195.1 hypothetical protein OG722_23845 [Streptomyces sp. NBC_01212]WSR06788.1 hypothetical protein OG265_12575 [Streptomyces sp. NBC_01208]